MFVLEGSVSQPPVDVLSDARSEGIRTHSRMRRNLLLISCNLMLLDLERAVDVERSEQGFPKGFR